MTRISRVNRWVFLASAGVAPVVTGARRLATHIDNPTNLTLGPRFEPLLLSPLGPRSVFETVHRMQFPVRRQASSLGLAQASADTWRRP